HAQSCEVQMRVWSLQRIEGPLDQVQALRQRALTLRQLQLMAQAAAAVLLVDAEHVRPLHHAAVLQARDRKDEAPERAALERAYQNSPALDDDREDRSRHDILVFTAPYAPLELHGVRKIVQRLKIAQLHIGSTVYHQRLVRRGAGRATRGGILRYNGRSI